MATELTAANRQVATIRDLITKSKSQIAMALPKHMNADRLMRIAMTAIQRNPQLLECTQTSLLGSIIQGAQLGVEPDGVRAHLVPRRNRKKGNILEAQLIVDYKGMMDLAARSNRVRISPPVAVYEKDDFTYNLGLEPMLKHKRYEGADRGKLTHVYAVARYKDGFDPDFVVLPRAEVDRHREASPAKDSGPWVDNYEAMALKTAVRVLCKFIPSSPELAEAVALDEKAEQGIPQDIDIDITDGQPQEQQDGKPASSLDALAQKMADEPKPETKPEPKPEEKPEPETTKTERTRRSF